MVPGWILDFVRGANPPTPPVTAEGKISHRFEMELVQLKNLVSMAFFQATHHTAYMCFPVLNLPTGLFLALHHKVYTVSGGGTQTGLT